MGLAAAAAEPDRLPRLAEAKRLAAPQRPRSDRRTAQGRTPGEGTMSRNVSRLAPLFVLLVSPLIRAGEPKVRHDLPYAEPKNERQTLDVYAPGAGKNHPVAIWI